MIRRLLAVISCILLATNVVAAPIPGLVIGEPLRAVIDRIEQLNIFSSSRLLTRRMVVRELPDSSKSPVEQVDEMLAPYGLVVEMTNDSTGYIAVIEQLAQEVTPTVATPVVVVPPPIEEIVVSAPYRLERTPQRKTLDSQELAQIPSIGGDTLRSIQVLPGISSDGFSARHRFRGGDNNEILYRLDGVTQIEAFHFSDVQSLFSAVSSSVVDSADVYVNGFPARFGTRMSGVVDLHLIEPQRPLQGSVDINMLAPSIELLGYKGNWSWLVSGRVSVIGQVLKKVQSPSEENLDTPSFNDQLARLSWNNGPNEIVFGAVRSEETLDVERESTGERGQGIYDYYDLWLRWAHHIGNDVTMTWQVNRFDADRSRIGSLERDFDAEGDLVARRAFDVTSLSNDWRWQIGNAVEYRAGLMYSRHAADYSAIFDAEYGPLGLPIQRASSEVRSLSISNSGPTVHGYLSGTRDFDNGVVVTAGVRYDGQEIAEVSAREWSGRMAIDWTLSEEWALDIDFGRYTQQQFLHEVQIDEGRTQLDPPQHADQVNLGLEWTPSDTVTVRADAFHRRIDDPWARFDNLYNRIVLLPELHGDRYLIAADQARAFGGEIAVTKSDEDWSWNLSYGYSRSEERVDGLWRRRSWDQPHTLRAGLSWRGDKWRIGAYGILRSGWSVTPLITDPSELLTRLNQDQLPTYFSLDVHVEREFQTKMGQIDLYLDVTNLTNRVNVSGFIYQDDFSRLDAKSLPIIPSLGLTWHWP